LKITIANLDESPGAWSVWVNDKHSGYVALSATADSFSLTWKGAWIRDNRNEVVDLTTPPSYDQALVAARELVVSQLYEPAE
jgi:hypothetical protein